ncbi:pentatricopeptide repeat-containing protein At1g08070, chloroplastic-like [Phalaenopsis equestris]|uniref:pentatricopeptide repeat-containing protein At1g08070, chloroplastic-like n=1 Tax=Phalaenopsis equestris TaxID=78828 RepID=UPI0009E421D6|nr:pentatricopeptide repeat-containing protein At1g08070, chloroplastic-like [Phalaenopsis equestris]
MEPATVTVSQAAQLHAQLVKTAPHSDSYLANATLRAYSKSSRPGRALKLFLHLQCHPFAPIPDHFTFSTLLSAAARLGSFAAGRQLHALLLKSALHSSSSHHSLNSLIFFYSSCRLLLPALQVFDEMPQRDVVSWTSAIAAAVDADSSGYALDLFESMMADGIPPNDATTVVALRACADLGALATGRRIHRFARVLGFSSNPNVSTALIDMYAKCGRLKCAEEIFDRMPEKDVFAWTAMIFGFSNHGKSREALDLFQRMVEMGVRPDDRTITAVLCACRSKGWVAEGYRVYNNMHKFGMRPRIQHYGCMVDLLARAGHLDEAEGFIKKIPIETDAVLWRTMIWASKLHGDEERAERLMEERLLLEIGSLDIGSYVLMGNVFGSVGKWREKAKVREMMVRRRVGKLPGCSRIEVNGMIHEFEAGDSGHPDGRMIYEKWGEVVEKLRMEGYSPTVSEVILDMEDEEKASQLNHHSEKLALAFGLIKKSPGEDILIVKNLRSCQDCHSAMKLISRVYNREITIRDRIKFHHFSNGICSCGDYW